MTSFPLTLALSPQAGRGNTPSPAGGGEGWGGGGISANAVIHGRQALLRSSIVFPPECGECRGALVARGFVDLRVEIPAMAVHCDQQRAEALDAEFPQRFGIQIVEIEVLDALDPGSFQRGGAADDREINAAE